MDAGTIQKNYDKGKTYLKNMGFFDLWPKCERFKAGDQWAPATERTKSLPRPVINVIRYIENHKVSSVVNDPVKMIFSPDELNYDDSTAADAASIFTQYSAAEWENIRQDELNESALEKAANIGTAIWHYYWNPKKKGIGKTLSYIGKLEGEVLDPINVFVGNPQLQDTQAQPYILVSSRESVDSVKEEAKGNGIGIAEISTITSDKNTSDEGYDPAQKEIDDKTTVITCYWREKDGFIWLMKVCGQTVIKKPVNTDHTLYPIVKMSWYDRDKCWYGQGDTESLINNQKTINLVTAMQIRASQLTGMPKPMMKEGYITNFTNDPSDVIIDRNPNGWSMQYLQPPAIYPKASELVDFLMTNSKTLSGATETATGELAKSSQMNATAIMLLQKASGVPIESIKKRFKRAIEDIGNIWLEFWTINYNTTRVVLKKDGLGQQVAEQFKGTDYKGIGLKLKIDIGVSTDYSETLIMTTLDKLHDRKDIDTPTYVEMAPDSVMPFKHELLNKLKEIEAKNQLMQQQLMQLQGGNNAPPQENIQTNIPSIPTPQM